MVEGLLRWKKSPYPNFEDMDSADGDNVYEVVVTATDGGVLRNSKDVTVTVENTEEAGSVSLSQRRPQEGIPITATLNDKDGNVSKTAWQWYRSDAGLGVNSAGDVVVVTNTLVAGTTELTDDGMIRNIVTDGDDTFEPAEGTEVPECDPDATTPVIANCLIKDATSATYIPTAADATGGGTDDDKRQQLVVVAIYKDGHTETGEKAGDARDRVFATSEQAAEARPSFNTRPRFLDKGPVERSVAENAKGASVGQPVAGIDTDPLKHKLSGDDAASFSIDDSGQITTKVKLDYETKDEYTVTVTATDPSGASASIMVNITVTDADDSADGDTAHGQRPRLRGGGDDPERGREHGRRDGDRRPGRGDGRGRRRVDLHAVAATTQTPSRSTRRAS